MTKKIKINWEKVHEAAARLYADLSSDFIVPDAIIILNRGGLIPGGLLSYSFDIRDIKLIDITTYHEDKEDKDKKNDGDIKNYLSEQVSQLIPFLKDKETILIVDDLVDSGNTLKLIKEVFNTEEFDKKEIITSVLFGNYGADYIGLPKPEGWLIFPWDDIFNKFNEPEGETL